MRLFALLVQLACRDSETRVAKRLSVGRSGLCALLFKLKMNIFERKPRTVCGEVLIPNLVQKLIPKLESFSEPKNMKNVKGATANLQRERHKL